MTESCSLLSVGAVAQGCCCGALWDGAACVECSVVQGAVTLKVVLPQCVCLAFTLAFVVKHRRFEARMQDKVNQNDLSDGLEEITLGRGGGGPVNQAPVN